jgi:hypothetical protein
MLFPVEKRLVNWVDGMKIAKNHLVQTEDYLTDMIRDTTSMRLTDNNYGLLPPYRGGVLSSDFEITNRISDNVEIKLRRCNAVTAGGCRININPTEFSEYLYLDYSFDADVDFKKENEKCPFWDIILVIRPFERIPTGIPDPEETPPRHPETSQEYRLFIQPAGEISSREFGMHHLVIGRVLKKGDRYEVDSNYIPPCTSMSSHPTLKSFYESFGQYLNDIETSSHKIIQKIHERENNSSIAKNINKVSETLLNYIATIYFSYKNNGRFYAPYEIVNVFSSLAHVCFSGIQYMSKREKEEMLQYFYEWNDITPGNFTELLTGTLEVIYNHHDIRSVMELVDQFLSVFAALWIKLSTLEYIGQRRENIVVAEKIQKQVLTTPKSGWTILD